MDTGIRTRWSVALIISLSLTVAGCGGNDTMASKSAAAFEEAKRKGVSLSGSAHGGHAVGTAHDQGSSDHSKMPGMSGSGTSGMDHSKMAGTSGSSMKGMDHSKMAGMSGSGMKGMDHSKMPGMSGSSMSGMDHSKMPGTSGSSMKGMDHSKTPAMSGMQHGSMSGMSQSEQALPDEPAATLSPDPLDAPAQTSVIEAERSAGMAAMMASGEHGIMSHGNYVHQDAGREQVSP